MKIRETELEAARLIELEKRGDERGFFARTFCEAEFAAAGLHARSCRRTIRTTRPAARSGACTSSGRRTARPKLVRVVRGAIYDVIIDLRRESPTYGNWQGFDLTAENGRMLYIPVGFAHGLQTLADETDIVYQLRTPTPRPPRAACAGTIPRSGSAGRCRSR